MKDKKTTSGSILASISNLQVLLSKQEKITWIKMIFLALSVSFLEIITATVIVFFAQVLNDPNNSQLYVEKLHLTQQYSSKELILYLSFFLGVLYLIKNLAASLEVFYQNFSIHRMCHNFKTKLLNIYSQSDYESYLNRNSSYGLQLVGGDAEQAFSNGMVAIAIIMSEGIILLFLVGMLFIMNPSLALIIFSLGLTFAIATWKFVLPKFYMWGSKLQKTGEQANKNLLQFFHAYKDIVLLDRKDAFINAYKIHSKNKSEIQALQNAINSCPRLAIEIVFVGMFVLTIAFFYLSDENLINMMGLLSGYLYAGFRIMPGLNRIINQLNTFKAVIPSIERIHNEYINISSRENYLNIPEFRFNQHIKFTSVYFRYVNTDRYALQDINLTIGKGECIGVIGETGSGKSTLIDLLLGLLKPTKGSILVDDTYIVNCKQWHNKIGYVPQSIYLTDNTIEENIAFGIDNIDSERLAEAIKIAQLEQFISSLTNGIKTFIGERGVRLSGGERQRIAIARAMYNRPEILIFDEATSALDMETEAKINETINTVKQTKTVIMIAHRLSTLKDCDRIIKVEGGKILEYSKTHMHKVIQNA